MASRRSVQFHARLSPAELAAWRAKAAAVGVPLSDLLRQAMARGRGRGPPRRLTLSASAPGRSPASATT